MQLGHLRVDPVIDGTGRFMPTKSFRTSTSQQWAVHQNLLDPDGLLEFAIGGFLIRSGDRTVLVDLGAGRRTVLGIEGGDFLNQLGQLGVAPGDVTDVVFTHLHADHVGWACQDGRPVFPRAMYRCSTEDWRHFMVEHRGKEYELLSDAEERFESWDHDGALLPGITTRLAPGHTPGSTVIVLSSGVERAMLLGDIVHCPVELVDDEWASIADMDVAVAARTKAALNRELEGSGTLVAAAHFPDLRFGRLVRGQGRRQWLI